MNNKNYKVSLLVCVLFSSCSLSQNASTTQNPNAPRPIEQLSLEGLEKPLDAQLLAWLKSEAGIEKPFAWGGTRETGLVIGFDRDRRLKSVRFTKTADGYSTELTEAGVHDDVVEIEKSGSLYLQNLLTECEFPFKSDIVTVGECHVHLVLEKRALQRSLAGNLHLVETDLRIIVQRGSEMISNKVERFRFIALIDSFVDDVNDDGKQDYVVIGQDNYKHVFIWTIGADCTAEPILFEFNGQEGPVQVKWVSGASLVFKPDSSGKRQTIHTREYDLVKKNSKDYWQTVETVYGWDARRSVYKERNSISWLEAAK